MPQLNNFNGDTQDDFNSCWAACGRSISNYFVNAGKIKLKIFISDQEFAHAWAKATNSARGSDRWHISIQQSAAAALGDLGMPNYIYSTPFPTVDEIKEDISDGKPVLAIIGANKPKNNKPNAGAKNGHWVCIVGIDDNGQNIAVYDPQNGKINKVAFDADKYNGYLNMYWQNSSYFDLG